MLRIFFASSLLIEVFGTWFVLRTAHRIQINDGILSQLIYFARMVDSLK